MRQERPWTSVAGVFGGLGAGLGLTAAAVAGGPVGAGDALVLDGTGDEVRAAVPMDLDAITVEAWVRVESLTDRASDGGSVMTYGIGSDQSFSLWLFDLVGTPEDDWRLAFQINFSNGNSQIVSAPDEALGSYDTWHHVAATYDESVVTLLLDGEVVATETLNVPINWVDGGELSIGHEFPGASEFIGGELDEVRVWSRVRTPSEIDAARSAPACGTEADLWALYRFDGGSAADATGQGRDLVPLDDAGFGPSDAPIQAEDADGDGVNDACATTCPADFDGSGAVEFDDLLGVLSNWGPCPAPCVFDLDVTGDVGFNDVLAVLAAFGPCP
jgi:hypothetical protein